MDIFFEISFFILGILFGFGAYRLVVLIVRRKRRSYPVTEIHVEKVEVDAIFNRLKEYCLKNPEVMLMLMVKNWKPTTQSLIMERYKELAKLGNPIGLHVHLAIFSEIDTLSFKKQKLLLDKGKRFLETELNIKINDFTPGWWSFNEDTLKATNEVGITNFHFHRIFEREMRLISDCGLTPVQVKNYLHDWNFVEGT